VDLVSRVGLPVQACERIVVLRKFQAGIGPDRQLSACVAGVLKIHELSELDDACIIQLLVHVGVHLVRGTVGLGRFLQF
jgi:hypothetical protein